MAVADTVAVTDRAVGEDRAVVRDRAGDRRYIQVAVPVAHGRHSRLDSGSPVNPHPCLERGEGGHQEVEEEPATASH